MSMPVMLVQDNGVPTDIKALLESKIKNILLTSISTIELKKTAFDFSAYKLFISNQQSIVNYLRSKGAFALFWDNLPSLSSEIDMFLQLCRYTADYPLNLRHWSLVEVLHNSDDAIIYRGVNQDGELAAIKRFKFQPNQLSRDVIHHFLERVEKQCALKSKKLVHFYEGGICNHAFYLVMEYLKYGTLRQTFNGCDKALPVIHALEWFQEIVIALDCVHQAGLIHRDLKMDNIMMRSDGSLALTDYGISKRILLDAGFLNEDEFHCSPHYVSPEQISGEPCTQVSDIYSLGVIFYELLTGQKPYLGNQAFEIMMQHVMAPVPQLPAHLSQFQGLLDKMMAKTPNDRFCCAMEAIEELKVAA